MSTLNRTMTKSKQCWAPHYDEVQEHTELPEGTKFRIVSQENVPWDDPEHLGGHKLPA